MGSHVLSGSASCSVGGGGQLAIFRPLDLSVLLVCWSVKGRRRAKQHSTNLFSYPANHSWFFVGDVACLLALFDPEVPFRRLKATAEAN